MKRIAVVEDNPDNLLLVSALLESEPEANYELDLYEDGYAAIEGIGRRVPDLVLMDVSLPGMDGTEVLARVRAQEEMARVPIIALTAHAMLGDPETYRALGFDAYVSKPIVNERILLGTIEKLLAGTAGVD